MSFSISFFFLLSLLQNIDSSPLAIRAKFKVRVSVKRAGGAFNEYVRDERTWLSQAVKLKVRVEHSWKRARRVRK